MDIGHTYSSLARARAVLYAQPGVEVPATLTLTEQGAPVEYFLLSDTSLHCGSVRGVTGSCESFDCHRLVLGECQCGRHGVGPDGEKTPVRYSKAVA